MLLDSTVSASRRAKASASRNRRSNGQSMDYAIAQGHLSVKDEVQIDPPLRANLDRRGREIFDKLVSCKPSFDWRQNDIMTLATIAALEVRTQDVLTIMSNLNPYEVTDESRKVMNEIRLLTNMTKSLYMSIGLGVINTTSGLLGKNRSDKIKQAIEDTSPDEFGLLAGIE